VTGKRNRPLIDRLMERVDAEGDCWVWTKRISPNGYGLFTAGTQGRVGQYAHMAHRQVWAELVGPIPEAMQLDHLCRNRACVNPDHMEPVTRAENMRRSAAVAVKRQKTECAQGHQYTPENTFVDKNGYRGCRICRRAASLKFAQKKRAALRAAAA
jgi:hypothetical protein